MADFNTAVQLTLAFEGGFVDNPSDPGGATKYGVTQADMPGTNIADITEAQAADYYSEHYWKPLYSSIESQLLANKLFDMGVLFGVGEAVKVLQIMLQSGVPSVTVDGDFGPETLAAVNSVEPNSALAAYQTALVTYMLRIVVNKPALRVFAAGWGRRINS
jgi:lysozyme family protein